MPVYVCVRDDGDYLPVEFDASFAPADDHGRGWVCYPSRRAGILDAADATDHAFLAALRHMRRWASGSPSGDVEGWLLAEVECNGPDELRAVLGATEPGRQAA